MRAPLLECMRMRTLFHMPFDPPSRFIRLILNEKRLTARFVEGRASAPESDLGRYNPALTIPVLIDETPSGAETAAAPAWAIVEYLEEVYTNSPLLPATSAGRAETRRLLDWFCVKFETDVAALTCRVVIDGAQMGRDGQDAARFQDSAEAIAWHFDYLSWLLERRTWLAGPALTAADLAGGAYLSVIDYLGLAPWQDFNSVKEWYARLKCRPSFRALLSERLEGRPPPAHYDNLDF